MGSITDRLPHTPKSLRHCLKGWSQRRLARVAGVSTNTVAAIEAGGAVASRSIHAVAKALGIQPWELMRAMDALHRPVLAGVA